MKLIRCYIENFGGLHQYALDFQEGLTVIHAPNGFGKTTLAEFIRAMFYGFPRAGKDLTKNPRARYLPWQGGRYGGYLVFEEKGKQYRIDRTFGKTTRGDVFKLTDNTTHLPSADYTADIGLELFGLDSDSFLRSTYMPQSHEGGALSTDNIRAKLSNLLEDTGDVGSYEKAQQRLRDRRTTYEHYRGSGGKIHALSKRITALQVELDICRSKELPLAQAEQQLKQALQEQALGEGALERLRKQLTEATTAQAEAALSREYEALLAAHTDTRARIDALREQFPKGIPDAQALETASEAMDRTAKLETRLQETPADRAAAQLAEAGAQRFAQGVPSDEDYAKQQRHLDRLTAASAALESADLSPEEKALLEQYRLCFAQGVPEDAWFDQYNAQAAELKQLEHSRKALEPDPTERKRLEQLEAMFAHGIPEDSLLTSSAEVLTELNSLQHSSRKLHLSDGETAQLRELDGYFALGLPDKAQLGAMERQLDRAEQLRRENLQISAAAPLSQPAPAAPQKKFHSLFLPMLILGLLCAAGGILLLVMPQLLAGIPALADQPMILGGGLAAAALVILIAAAFLQNNHSIMNRLQAHTAPTGMTPEQRRLMEENDREAAALEAQVASFLQSYPAASGRSLRSRLADLETNLSLYLPLVSRRDALEREAADNRARCDQLASLLHSRLSPYFDSMPPFDSALQTLMQAKPRYLELRERADKRRAAAKENDLRTKTLTRSLQLALSPYFDTILSFENALQTLDRRRQQYDELLKKQAQLQERAKALTEEISALETELAQFLKPYCEEVPPHGFRECLNSLRRDADSYTAAAERVRSHREALAKQAQALEEAAACYGQFCQSYGLSIDIHDRQGLKQLERRVEELSRLERECTAAKAALDRFLAEHGPKPKSALPSVQYDLDGLRLGEQELIGKQNTRSKQILQTRQQLQQLREQVDRIPDLTDELARCTEQKAADTHSRELLDLTMDYLKQAREQLSASYMGGVQGHFAKYLGKLTGEQAGHITMTPDLEVQLERAGSARDLPYFSAGQTDAVQLCMRLALSDALFGDKDCFMVLDDPFVNLDDQHTAQALALLQELAEERQIVYLVCNESRVI